jgi:glutamate 5-kinase
MSMTSSELRRDVLANARRIVVKMGTSVLTSKDPLKPGLDLDYLRNIARQIHELRQRKIEVTVVSSGAIGAGCVELGIAKRPKDLPGLQGVAAVGQPLLMSYIQEAFKPHGVKVAQLLLTRNDFEKRNRFLNIRNCMVRLHELGCVPILNENDTVSIDELRFGDNDMLAALSCNALRAEVLIMLTVVDGLLDPQGRKIEFVENAAESRGLARKDKSSLGTGGMVTKLEAARLVTEAGEVAVIANGREPDVLLRLFDAQPVGTVFAPMGRKLDSRSRWIGLTKRPAGVVAVDDGAVAALCDKGKSLLAAGITACNGHFEEGQVISVTDQAGKEVARGLTNYGADDLRLILGKSSIQIEKTLGRPAYAEVIHRDNLVVNHSP